MVIYKIEFELLCYLIYISFNLSINNVKYTNTSVKYSLFSNYL